MIHIIKIYKTTIFSTIANEKNSEMKKGVGWEATLNQGDSSFPDTCRV